MLATFCANSRNPASVYWYKIKYGVRLILLENITMGASLGRNELRRRVTIGIYREGISQNIKTGGQWIRRVVAEKVANEERGGFP